jgi:hypothetical protein
MFDLRYHVASLAAVFLALIIGILVGVGISGKGFVSDSERRLLDARIAELEGRLDAASSRSAELTRAHQDAETFIDDTYPALVAGRLRGVRVALVFVGPPGGRVRSLLEQTLADAGAPAVIREWSLKVPVDSQALRAALARRPALAQLAAERRVDELGRRLATDFVARGESPLWRLVADRLVEERSGSDGLAADAVVVARTAEPQQGTSARFVRGFYEGLAASRGPAVGVELAGDEPSVVPAFANAELSTVDDLDGKSGRFALVLLLGGARRGHYGVKENAADGLLPPISPRLG